MTRRAGMTHAFVAALAALATEPMHPGLTDELVFGGPAPPPPDPPADPPLNRKARRRLATLARRRKP